MGRGHGQGEPAPWSAAPPAALNRRIAASRLRLGIGSALPGVAWEEFVLSDFLPEEREAVNGMVETAADAIETAVRQSLDAAMRRFNAAGGAADQGEGQAPGRGAGSP